LKKQAETLSGVDNDLLKKLLGNTVDVNSTNPSGIIDVKAQEQPLLMLLDHLKDSDKKGLGATIRSFLEKTLDGLLGPKESNTPASADGEKKTKP
jgi:hypothetical protein